ncbi:MAG: BrnT family toxin [Nitrospinae bacterium]|nr:BrnT family toxin [Nitrospinota bacterium]
MKPGDVVWDISKAAANKKKHGVDFHDAVSVFEDPSTITVEDERHSEQRFLAIGQNITGEVIVIVFAFMDDGKTRLISARKATRRERQYYEKGS